MTARIEAFPSAFLGLVPSIVRRLRERSADAEITLVRCGHDEAIARVRRAELDASLVFSRLDVGHDGADLRIVETAIEPMLALLPKTHPLARRRRIELAALTHERWIVGASDDPSFADRGGVSCGGIRAGDRLHDRRRARDAEPRCCRARRVDELPWLASILRDDVVLRPLAEPVPTRRISAVAAAPTLPAADLLVELARTALPERH